MEVCQVTADRPHLSPVLLTNSKPQSFIHVYSHPCSRSSSNRWFGLGQNSSQEGSTTDPSCNDKPAAYPSSTVDKSLQGAACASVTHHLTSQIPLTLERGAPLSHLPERLHVPVSYELPAVTSHCQANNSSYSENRTN